MTAKEAKDYLVAKVPPDEPVFILRGQDMCALETIHDWISRAVKLGAPNEKITGALAVANRFREWSVKKVPD